MTFNYDARADVLYLTFETPKRGPQFHHIEAMSGDIYRIDEDRHVVVGCTVRDFLKRVHVEEIDLPEIGPVSYDPSQMSLFQPQEA